MLRRPAVALLVVIASALAPVGHASAQSISQFAAWSALMLSPVGALPAVERDSRQLSRGWEVDARYGRWRYDIDDAIHDDAGLTLSHALAGAVDLSVTGAYLSLSCGTCAGWISGGLQARVPLVNVHVASIGERDVSLSLGLRGDVGLAHYRGEGGANARSISGNVAITLETPAPLGSRLAFAVLPGIGGGRVVSVDLTAQDTRPMLGGTVAWTFRSGLALHAGIQRIVIDGGPSQLGLALSWR